MDIPLAIPAVTTRAPSESTLSSPTDEDDPIEFQGAWCAEIPSLNAAAAFPLASSVPSGRFSSSFLPSCVEREISVFHDFPTHVTTTPTPPKLSFIVPASPVAHGPSTVDIGLFLDSDPFDAPSDPSVFRVFNL